MTEVVSPPKRVLVLWADLESDNLGLRVLAEGARELAVRAWGDVEVQYHSHNTPSTPLCRRMVVGDIGRPDGSIKKFFESFDVILDTGGGDSFSDIYGLRRLVLQSYMYHAARVSGVPIVMTPQTVGPFGSRIGKLLAKYVLKRASLVATRDHISSQMVHEIRGYPAESLSTDMAFLLSTRVPPSNNLVQDDSLHVVVNVSGLLWHPNGHVDSAFYQESVRSLLRCLIEKRCKVSLLAHVLDSPLADNDVPVVLRLGEEYPTVSVLIPSSLDEARSMMASASIVVASRMHACLNSLSVGTPTIAWAYSRKFLPLLKSLEWDLVFDLRCTPTIVDQTIDVIDTSSLIICAERAGKARQSAHDLFRPVADRMRSLLESAA